MSEYTSYLKFFVEVQHHKVVDQAKMDHMQGISWSVSRKDWAASKISHPFILLKIVGFLGNS